MGDRACPLCPQRILEDEIPMKCPRCDKVCHRRCYFSYRDDLYYLEVKADNFSYNHPSTERSNPFSHDPRLCPDCLRESVKIWMGQKG